MITKLLLCFFSTAAGTIVGLMLSKRLKRRRAYFEELVSLINRLESEIRFRQDKLVTVLQKETNDFTSKLKTNAQEFIAYAGGGEWLLSRQDLTKREHAVVTDFFKGLGTTDAPTQLFLFESYRIKSTEFYAAALKAEQAYGRATVKIGFLAGLALGILML